MGQADENRQHLHAHVRKNPLLAFVSLFRGSMHRACTLHHLRIRKKKGGGGQNEQWRKNMGTPNQEWRAEFARTTRAYSRDKLPHDSLAGALTRRIFILAVGYRVRRAARSNTSSTPSESYSCLVCFLLVARCPCKHSELVSQACGCGIFAR